MARIKQKLSPKNKNSLDKFLKREQANERTPKTLENIHYTITRLGNFLGKTNFEDATEEQMQNYFKTIKSFNTRDIAGSIIIKFLQSTMGLQRRERPKNMLWFEYTHKKTKQKNQDPEGMAKKLITPEEYKIIIDACEDELGQWQAIFETFYLSGMRLSELACLKIGNVLSDSNENIIIRVPESKTKPRDIPLPGKPEHLIKWLVNHPQSKDKEAPLWLSMANKNMGQQLGKIGIQMKLWQIKKANNIKQSITLHSFRKTRASIMFGSYNEKGKWIYDNQIMASFFGWEPSTVDARRKQYDGSKHMDTLRKAIFGEQGANEKYQTYETIKEEKEQLEAKHAKEINLLKEKMVMLERAVMLAMKDNKLLDPYPNK